MRSAVPSYLFCLVDVENRVVGVHTLACRDDIAARAKAKPLCAHHDIEIWEGSRRVARLRRDGTTVDHTAFRKPPRSKKGEPESF
jgi:hypothetical protein